MTSRRTTQQPRIPASHPPVGLAEFDYRVSTLARIRRGSGSSRPEPAGEHGWHYLDNGAVLADNGIEPVGTLVCVHGNPTWSYLWRRLVSAATDTALAGGTAWRVVAVDQLNMGFSERTGEAKYLADRVADLADFTAGIGIEGPVYTVGHDWGGVVSMGWAVDHPELLSGIILLNTAIHQPEDARIPWPLRVALQSAVLDTATVTSTGFLDTTLALGHPALSREIKAAYRSPYRGVESRFGIGDFVADIPATAEHTSSPELDRIAAELTAVTVPSLMLWGPRDPIFSDRYLDDLRTRLPHADVHRFPTAGHLIAEDVDYAAVILDWLDSLRDADTGSTAPVESSEPSLALDTNSVVAVEPDRRRAPLWSYLDEFSASGDPALIDMVAGPRGTRRTVSWRLLSKRVSELATGLVSIGVRPGDRIALLIPPSADLTAVLYAAIRIGAVVVVADAGLGLVGLTRASAGSRPDYVIGATPGLAVAAAFSWPGVRISTGNLPRPAAAALGVRHSLSDLVRLGSATPMPPEPDPNDIAAILFTSGSTGPAKGVVYTHEQLSAVRDALRDQYGVGPGTGLVAGFAPFALLGPALGARSVTPDMNVTAPRTLTAVAVAEAAAAVDATVVFLSPAALTNVVATASTLSGTQRAALAEVTTFLSAGAPISAALLADAVRLMPSATGHTPYGMTEGLLLTDITLDGILSAAEDESENAAGGVCVGRPTGSAVVRIRPLDDAGLLADQTTDRAGVTGEIVVSAPHLRSHYDGLWNTNRVAQRGSTDVRRWHSTGDVGRLDAAGRLWIEGRLQHVVVTAAGIVTPVGPEQRVEALDGVSRAAVVGVGPTGTAHLVVILESSQRRRRTRRASAETAAAVRAAVGLPVAAVFEVGTLPTDIRHNSKIDRQALSRWATRVLEGGRLVNP